VFLLPRRSEDFRHSLLSTRTHACTQSPHSQPFTDSVPVPSDTLAYLGCTAIFASLSDVVGRRDSYIAASTLFIAFSLGCGWARDLNQLIAFRALQGVGGSGLYSIGFVILPEISSVKMSQMIGALAGGVIAMSGVLGPVLGGIITNYTTWYVSRVHSACFSCEAEEKYLFAYQRY
jgi:MFS family permease